MSIGDSRELSRLSRIKENVDLAGHSLLLVLLNHTGLFTLEMLLFYSLNNNSLIVLVISITLAAMVVYQVKLLSTSPVLVVFKLKVSTLIRALLIPVSLIQTK